MVGASFLWGIPVMMLGWPWLCFASTSRCQLKIGYTSIHFLRKDMYRSSRLTVTNCDFKEHSNFWTNPYSMLLCHWLLQPIGLEIMTQFTPNRFIMFHLVSLYFCSLPGWSPASGSSPGVVPLGPRTPGLLAISQALLRGIRCWATGDGLDKRKSCMAFHGFPWLSMDFRGFPWISMDFIKNKNSSPTKTGRNWESEW